MELDVIKKEVGDFFIGKMTPMIESEKDEEFYTEMKKELALQTVRALVCMYVPSNDEKRLEEAVVNVFTAFVNEVSK